VKKSRKKGGLPKKKSEPRRKRKRMKYEKELRLNNQLAILKYELAILP